MRITIDTHTDRYEDIQRAVHLLADILHQKNDSFSSSSPVPEDQNKITSAMGMFDDSSKESAPDFGSFLKLSNGAEKKKEEEIPKIEFF